MLKKGNDLEVPMNRASLRVAVLSFLSMVLVSVFAQAESPRVDFDGQGVNGKTPALIGRSAAQSSILSSAGGAMERVAFVVRPATRAVAGLRVFQKLPSGKEIVQIDSLSGLGVAKAAPTVQYHADNMPNDIINHTLTCSNPDTGFTVSVHYQFDPKIGGHAHEPADPLPLLDDHGAPLPNPIVRSAGVGEPINIGIKLPVFSTNLTLHSHFSGGCEGMLTDDVDVKVTAKGVIQLEELSEDDNLGLKKPTKDHPDSYNGTPDTNARLKQIAREYHAIYPDADIITVTDIGLPWGGRFSVAQPPQCWTEGRSHQYHRYGRQVDIRITSIPPANRACFEEIACKYFVEPAVHNFADEEVLNLAAADVPYFPRTSKEEAALDDAFAPHYHLNFAMATDAPVTPPDQAKQGKCAVMPAPRSKCPPPPPPPPPIPPPSPKPPTPLARN